MEDWILLTKELLKHKPMSRTYLLLNNITILKGEDAEEYKNYIKNKTSVKYNGDVLDGISKQNETPPIQRTT